MVRAMGGENISDIRWLGGKIGIKLSDNGYFTMKDIQDADLGALEYLMGKEQSQWVRDLSIGVCFEEVKEKSQPTSVYAEKTFRKIATFDDFKEFIILVILDLTSKVDE
jgi:nucleotidyltransferase/DNA polymerase involved in DNA repair